MKLVDTKYSADLLGNLSSNLDELCAGILDSLEEASVRFDEKRLDHDFNEYIHAVDTCFKSIDSGLKTSIIGELMLLIIDLSDANSEETTLGQLLETFDNPSGSKFKDLCTKFNNQSKKLSECIKYVLQNVLITNQAYGDIHHHHQSANFGMEIVSNSFQLFLESEKDECVSELGSTLLKEYANSNSQLKTLLIEKSKVFSAAELTNATSNEY